ncbi:unnamed protein product [Enterobius vermicularis]|uniref:Myosin motor domain-containing protein n=1 Tax=Enterobius vermicularis TaxID=51028 RepID=A0A0N4V283_ENTVE|nr:unnamed protein product [Enterobius vermicularis]
MHKFISLTTLIHAFCGAKTRKNDRATRIGYSLDLMTKNGSIYGFAPKLLLPLELVRLVSQRQGEKNFEIFYHLCAGLSPELRRKFGLKEAQKYFYLNLGRCSIDNEAAEQEKFANLQNAFKALDMSDDQQTFIFRILAAILHLGNLFFTAKKVQDDEAAKVEIANEAEIKWTAYLLEIDIDEWRSLFLKKKTTGEEPTTVPLTLDQALDMRDSIAQVIYNSLVQWIISLIANDYGCTNHSGVISLLDYYGFERYNNNAYEHLCVNIVNECIESFYVKKVFKDVQKELDEEMIKMDYQVPSWIDNKRVLDLLLKRPDGLVFLLDDECKFPKASNEGYLRRCDLNHSENGVYGKARSKDRLEFAVKHYAGFTYYNVDHFVQKNRRQICCRAVQLLAGSNIKQKKLKFGKVETATKVNEFRTHCQFIRCFRSNSERLPEKFCDQTVMRQIRAYALLDTVKMSRHGYNFRQKVTSFAKRYACLLPKEATDFQNVNEKVNDILEQQGVRYQERKTNIHLKDDLYMHLEKLRSNIRERSAIIIQKMVRGFLARKNYERQRHAAVVLQSGLRAWKARKEVKAKREEMIQKIGYETRRSGRIGDTTDVGPSPATDSAAFVQYLDLPEDLQKQLAIIRNPKMFKTRSITHYIPMPAKCHIPKLPRLIAIEDFAESCFKGHLLGARREPIVTPFLQKDNDEDFREALLIFKLILRYLNDTQLSEEKLAILGKYIIQKGIDMPEQRDEIFVQLCNQTYNNRVKTSCIRAWTLMLGACNSFAPIFNDAICLLITYLLFSCIFQKVILEMQIKVTFRGIGEPEGWSVSLVDQDWTIDCAENQYLYDMIAQRELLSNYSKQELSTVLNKTFFVVFDNQPFSKVSD